ncbi:MAG TPA: TlpA disulfide reductase family protein [Kofleriaceae bacterium]|nr:TlpA disulfide reductase family protein [Kofleriaceae bacterium]
MNKLVLAALVLIIGTGCRNKDQAPPATATGSGSGSGAGSSSGSGTGSGSGSDGASEGDAAPFVTSARAMLVGHRAPAVTLGLLDGSRVELGKLLGQRPIYLKFWATWCVPCREQMPHLQATFDKYGDKLAVYAIDIGVDDPIENVRDMVKAKQLTMPVAYDRDGSVSEQFFLNVTPQHVLIDKAGIVRFVGHAVTPELERTIATLVSDGAEAVTAVPASAAAQALPALVLDNGSKLDLATRPKAPIALTFVTLFCDSYIADSRPATGATCAARAKQLEQQRTAHPNLAWVIVAYPVWTSSEDIDKFRKRLGIDVPIGIDRGNAWFRRFGVRDSYTTVLLAGDGTELGRVDGDGAKLAALIDKAH